MIREYRTISKINGSILSVDGVAQVSAGQICELVQKSGETFPANVLEVSGEKATVVYSGNVPGICPDTSKVRFFGTFPHTALSEDVLGRALDGTGKPMDNGPPILAEAYGSISAQSAHSVVQSATRPFIQTGISAIDALNTLACGQKLAVFSEPGLPNIKLAMQIAKQSKTLGSESDKFVVIFAGIGMSQAQAAEVISGLNSGKIISSAAAFINTASDPVPERLQTPLIALTNAEYLANEKGMNVLVILFDMTNYCDALREVSALQQKRHDEYGYPLNMHLDLAAIFQRAGKLENSRGSVTILSMLTTPGGDVSHPIPIAMSAAADGKIVLSRELYKKGISPPVDVFSSTSYFREKSTGAFKTREDHAELVDQLVDAYQRGITAIDNISRFGKRELTESNLLYARFADGFEHRFINQKQDEERLIGETLDLGWDLLSSLPKDDFKRVAPQMITRYMPI